MSQSVRLFGGAIVGVSLALAGCASEQNQSQTAANERQTVHGALQGTADHVEAQTEDTKRSLGNAGRETSDTVKRAGEDVKENVGGSDGNQGTQGNQGNQGSSNTQEQNTDQKPVEND